MDALESLEPLPTLTKTSKSPTLTEVGKTEPKKIEKNPMLNRSSLINLVDAHADRLGVPRDKALPNALAFAEKVGIMENDGKLQGQNKKSSAKGLYGFTDGTVQDAIERVNKYIPNQEWLNVLKSGASVNDLDKDQQTLLFLGNIMEKNAIVDGKRVVGLGDEILKKVLTDGDTGAMQLAYELLHHTAFDKATTKRANKIFGEADGEG